MPFVKLPAMRPALPVLLLFAFSLVLLAGLAAHSLAQGTDKVEAVRAFDRIAAVMRHPRCMNCHQETIPLQGEERRLHIPRVVRGEDNLGVTALRCTNCHNETNNTASRVPGAPHWSLAPASMEWQGLSTPELCQALTDKERNGGKSLDQLVEHMGSDPLVLWGWTPGGGREPVDVDHDDLMKALRLWVAAGGPCPS